MGELSKLPNIGSACEERLSLIGVKDINTFLTFGSKNIFIKLWQKEGDTCFSVLCALEGAIQGIRWHNLSLETKNDLKNFFRSIK